MASCFFFRLPACLMLLTTSCIALGSAMRSDWENTEALFVFGDSYVDTGNHEPLDAMVNTPWKKPYGYTWPGHPSGRFSDGRVLTDFFAGHLGIETPVAYRVIQKKVNDHGNNGHAKIVARQGINFAYGGSGVFPTFGPQYPTVSTQIDQLRTFVHKGLVGLSSSSLALLVVAGNDYTVYGIQHPGEKGIYNFIHKVVNEIVNSVELLYELGFQRVAVTNLEPFGCFPGVSYLSNYTRCNKTQNQESGYHNTLLTAQISKLQARLPKLTVLTLDLERTFILALQGYFSSDRRSQWRSCCEAQKGSRCGDVNVQGKPLYKLCSRPQRHLYWDSVHPTDFGWKAVSRILFSP